MTALRDAFEHYDRLDEAVRAGGRARVVTHGEPHAANVMRDTDGRMFLIDWDTVALAPPERDLWHVAPATDGDWMAYTRGWAEVALRVRDLEQMLTFYRDVVGLDVARQDEHMAFLVVPGTDETKSLALFDASVGADVPSITFSSVEPDKGSLHHFAFAIARDEHDAQRDRLEALGLAVRAQQHAWVNALSLFFSDPEGNGDEFVSYG